MKKVYFATLFFYMSLFTQLYLVMYISLFISELLPIFVATYYTANAYEYCTGKANIHSPVWDVWKSCLLAIYNMNTCVLRRQIIASNSVEYILAPIPMSSWNI